MPHPCSPSYLGAGKEDHLSLEVKANMGNTDSFILEYAEYIILSLPVCVCVYARVCVYPEKILFWWFRFH